MTTQQQDDARIEQCEPHEPLPCPRCDLLKDGSGLLCAYCDREQRIETEETSQ